MDYLLKMHSLSASYGTNIVLQDVEFIVMENDFIGVIGPNGGGKTTLLRIILGLLKPVSGNIVFNTNLVVANTIGYLPQMSTGDVSYPVTVTDIVLSGLMMRKGIISRMTSTDKRKAERVIGELGLTGLENATLNELSGGQMQRVFLGRAIIGDPKLLLLDEPGNFVDNKRINILDQSANIFQ